MHQQTAGTASLASSASLLTSPSTSTLELYPSSSSSSRRTRPPNLRDASVSSENRAPLRAESSEKLSRRESRMGLRGIFSRAAVQDVRASLVDLGRWPMAYTQARNESIMVRDLPTPIPEGRSPTQSQQNLAQQKQQQEKQREKSQEDLQGVPDESKQQPKGQSQVRPQTEPSAKPPQQQQRQPEEPIQTSSVPERPHTLSRQPSITPPASIASSTSSKPKKNAIPARSKTPVPTTRSRRGSLATWDPPPLFQAYPQAIKHAQLLACATPIEALLRMQGSRHGSISGSSLRDASSHDLVDEGSISAANGRKHGRNTSASSHSHRLEWASKIYVLVTSGYLLQYAGEGSFDRLPEKMLQISKDSAAFASDLIPGRHWVLQVCSSMEESAHVTEASRSLFSRLPFRTAERRNTSTFLMVFDGADEMENWITTLRREIEHLGGRKHLSETGKPVPEDVNVLELKAQPSQRTLVVRDPDRFSRLISPEDLPMRPDSAADVLGSGENNGGSSSQSSHDMPVCSSVILDHDDDTSATNSMVSQDGNNLENLRDSAGRLSFISSGQRTVVTSEGSSAPCSPVRDSFVSNHGESLATETPGIESPGKEAKPRPNASAILDRRQSIRHNASSAQAHQAHSATASTAASALPAHQASTATPAASRPEMAAVMNGFALATGSIHNTPPPFAPPQQPLPSIPNFSNPHKRQSTIVKTPSMERMSSAAAHSAPVTSASGPKRKTAAQHHSAKTNVRRPPPPSLAFSRPLSIVSDQPSPMLTPPPRSLDSSHAGDNNEITESNESNESNDSSATSTMPGQNPALWSSPHQVDADTQHGPSNLAQVQAAAHASSRHHSNMPSSSHPSSDGVSERNETERLVMPMHSQRLATDGHRMAEVGPAGLAIPRSRSAMGSYGNRQASSSPTPSLQRAGSHRFARPSAYGAQAGRGLVRSPSAAASYATSLPQPTVTPELYQADGTIETTRGRRPAKLPPTSLPTPESDATLRSESGSAPGLFGRKSMPRLAEGPPPAPPPTRALPPLPAPEAANRRHALDI